MKSLITIIGSTAKLSVSILLCVCLTCPSVVGAAVSGQKDKSDLSLLGFASPAPPIMANGSVTESRLTYHSDPTLIAQTSGSSLNLEDLGFNKADSQRDDPFQKRLNRRTKMLKAHQIFGLATGVAMALALSKASGTGTKGDAGKDAREDHEKYGLATGALYLTTASLAVFAPKVPGQKVTGRTKIHKMLAFIHFPAMLATVYLGISDKKKLDRGEDPSGLKPAVATVAAASFYTALAVMVIPFGGDK